MDTEIRNQAKEEAQRLARDSHVLLTAIRDATIAARDPTTQDPLRHWLMAHWLTELHGHRTNSGGRKY